jgi:DNA adenine methylase
LKNQIIELIPSHKTYVEPFVGGGSVFFGRKTKSDIEVINDLDKDIYDIYQDMKDVGDSMINRSFISDRKTFEDLMKKTVFINIEDRLFRNLYLSFISYCGVRDSYGGDNKNRGSNSGSKWKTDKWMKRLENVRIYNNDARDVIKKYDSIDTFFYLDPPYSKLKKDWGYTCNTINNTDMLEILKSIKGKFLMSYDDTPENRSLFKDFTILSVNTLYQMGLKDRKMNEIFIMNY